MRSVLSTLILLVLIAGTTASPSTITDGCAPIEEKCKRDTDCCVGLRCISTGPRGPRVRPRVSNRWEKRLIHNDPYEAPQYRPYMGPLHGFFQASVDPPVNLEFGVWSLEYLTPDWGDRWSGDGAPVVRFRYRVIADSAMESAVYRARERKAPLPPPYPTLERQAVSRPARRAPPTSYVARGRAGITSNPPLITKFVDERYDFDRSGSYVVDMEEGGEDEKCSSSEKELCYNTLLNLVSIEAMND
ncbi:hypothetical protein FPV67DRAFT_1444583 [Lyophyllum atratum]|nr:hypothetical protein FPV67DRAFT_1444583 [Lyophyllum atratum]